MRSRAHGEPGESDLAARARRRVESARVAFGLGDIFGGIGIGLGLNVLLQTPLGICCSSDANLVELVRWMPVTQLLYLVPLATRSWRRRNRELALGLALAALLTLFVASMFVGYTGRS